MFKKASQDIRSVDKGLLISQKDLKYSRIVLNLSEGFRFSEKILNLTEGFLILHKYFKSYRRIVKFSKSS